MQGELTFRRGIFGGGVVELAAGGAAFSKGMYAPELYAAARGGYLNYR